jgi:hypothetical protein
MIAEVISTGNSFKNATNYLYEGQLKGRGKTDKQAQLVGASALLRVPHSAADKETRKILIADFERQASASKNLAEGKNVGMHVLSFTTDDMRGMTNERLQNITNDYINISGIDKTQFIAISHKDTDNFHVHIMFNKVLNNGKKFSEWKEKNKTIERGIAVSLKHKLDLTSKQKDMSFKKEVLAIRSQMSDILELKKANVILQTAKNMHHLNKLAEISNIKISELKNGVSIGGSIYSKQDLNAVFLSNRNEKLKNNFTLAEESKIHFSEGIMKDKTKDLNLAKEIDTDANDLYLYPNPVVKEEATKLKKDKKLPGHKIKIDKLHSKDKTKQISR